MVELRDYLAEERTFLAWIRTGLALMGFGFVVARFDIVGDLTNMPQQLLTGQPHEFSIWLGAALVAIGAIMNLFSAGRFMRLAAELKRDRAPLPLQATGISGLFPGVPRGVAMTIYLTLFLTQPPHELHAAIAGVVTGKWNRRQ